MSQKAITLWNGAEVRCFEAASSEADFELLTWTFKIHPDTQVGAGEYLLVSAADLAQAVQRKEA